MRSFRWSNTRNRSYGSPDGDAAGRLKNAVVKVPASALFVNESEDRAHLRQFEDIAACLVAESTSVLPSGFWKSGRRCAVRRECQIRAIGAADGSCGLTHDRRFSVRRLIEFYSERHACG